MQIREFETILQKRLTRPSKHATSKNCTVQRHQLVLVMVLVLVRRLTDVLPQMWQSFVIQSFILLHTEYCVCHSKLHYIRLVLLRFISEAHLMLGRCMSGSISRDIINGAALREYTSLCPEWLDRGKSEYEII